MKKELTAILLAGIIIIAAWALAACGQHVCTFSKWEIVKEPTCVSEGLRERHCTADDCDKVQQEKIAIDNTKHELASVNRVEANCTTDGNIAYKHCSLCNKNFDQNGNELTNITLPKGHHYKVVSAVSGGMHIAGTIDYRTCKVCNKNFALSQDVELSDDDLIASINHNYNPETLYCSDCDKYFITNSAQLALFRDSVNEGEKYKGKTVELEADIDLENELWTPINGFFGAFDGNGHVIKNLKIIGGDNADSAGLFGNQWQCSATIRNFTVDGVNITGVKNVGVIVGYTASTSISGITVKNAVINANHWAGGIVGYAYANIDGCTVDGLEIVCVPNVDGSGFDNGDKVGGIAGYLAASSVTNCSVSNIALTGYRDIGGIVGTLQCADGRVAFATDNSATNVTICVDQVTNFYGAKDMNVDAIAGRVLNDGNKIAVIEDNNATNVSYQYIVANSSSAQKALDSAKSNSTITLAAGNYGKLFIRQSKYVSVKTNEGSYPWYKRELINVNIVGVDGTVVNGIEVISGHIYSASGNSVTDPVTGNTQNYYSNIMCNNLSFEGIEFTDYMEFNGWENTLFTLDGLEISNCQFDMTNSVKASKQGSTSCVHIGSSNGERNIKNITIDTCDFTNAFQGIYVVNVENLKVSNCKFENLKHNAVAVQSSDKSSVCGDIVIQDNTFTNGEDRVVRFNNIDETASIVITDNVITEYCDSDGEILKTGAAVVGATILFDNNTYGETVLETKDITCCDSAVVIKNS